MSTHQWAGRGITCNICFKLLIVFLSTIIEKLIITIQRQKLMKDQLVQKIFDCNNLKLKIRRQHYKEVFDEKDEKK